MRGWLAAQIGMLIWLAIQAAQTNTPRVATLAAPITTAAVVFSPAVRCDPDLSIVAVSDAVGRVMVRVGVAVAISVLLDGAPGGRFGGNPTARRVQYITVLNTDMHPDAVMYRVAYPTVPQALRSEA